ncbi:MAG: hypothetical protein Q7R54_02270 [bacterium]|nr:hypothetical protein [bacterium]
MRDTIDTIITWALVFVGYGLVILLVSTVVMLSIWGAYTYGPALPF